jgi:hypothetical protein
MLPDAQGSTCGSWPIVDRKFRLACTTALVPAGWYYHPCSGPVPDKVLQLSVIKFSKKRKVVGSGAEVPARTRCGWAGTTALDKEKFWYPRFLS